MRDILFRLIQATHYALHGLSFAIRHEAAFRYECFVMAFAVPAASLLAQDWRDVLQLLTPLVMAMALELCNTAIEQAVNIMSDGEIKPVFKVIKDCASAAVFVMLIWCGLTWAIYVFCCVF